MISGVDGRRRDRMRESAIVQMRRNIVNSAILEGKLNRSVKERRRMFSLPDVSVSQHSLAPNVRLFRLGSRTTEEDFDLSPGEVL